MEIGKAIEIVLRENKRVLGKVKRSDVEKFIKCILEARKIFLAGEGRSGLVSRTFAVRLLHLGFDVYVTGETITPNIGKGDLLIACSGSGETEVTFHMAEVARICGSKVVSLTANPNSVIVNVSDLVIGVPAPFKGKLKHTGSRQYSGSLFEQGLFILLEAITLVLIKKLKESPEEFWKRHTKLE